jgi:hypothetical protein
MIKLREYTLLTDVGKVPSDLRGVYSFSLRFPSDYELGLSSARKFDLATVNSLISVTLNRYRRAHDRSRLLGMIQGNAVGEHLRVTYELFGRHRTQVSPGELFTSFFSQEPAASVNELQTIVGVLRAFCATLPPLYVGMTCRQSLRDRLNQHLSGSTQLSEHLKRIKLDWTELIFVCAPLELASDEHFRTLEKVVQSLTKPPLSSV